MEIETRATHSQKPTTLRTWLEEAPVTVAFSSGFFGFFAHCGVAAALYEAGIRPKKASGASAGALVAAALASKLEPGDLREILFAVRQKDFWDPFPGLGYLRGQKFLRLMEKHLVGSFSDTIFPVEVAVVKLPTLKTEFLDWGHLPKAVVASCAVPFMFHPVRIGHRFYVDGGVFKKSGFKSENTEERILSIFLGSEPLPKPASNHRVLQLGNLPRVVPDRLENGQEAFVQAYRRTKISLALPPRDRRVEA